MQIQAKSSSGVSGRPAIGSRLALTYSRPMVEVMERGTEAPAFVPEASPETAKLIKRAFQHGAQASIVETGPAVLNSAAAGEIVGGRDGIDDDWGRGRLRKHADPIACGGRCG